MVLQNFDTATKVSFRISGRVHARAGIQGIQKRIWIHASRVRSGHNVLNGVAAVFNADALAERKDVSYALTERNAKL